MKEKAPAIICIFIAFVWVVAWGIFMMHESHVLGYKDVAEYFIVGWVVPPILLMWLGIQLSGRGQRREDNEEG